MTWVHYKTWNPHAWPPWPTEPTGCASGKMVSRDPDMPTPEPEMFARFSYIQSGDRRFALRRELMASLKQAGALWSCEFDDLHLMGYDYSPEQAIQRFMDDFAVAYDGLVGEADDHLTADARQLRDALSDLVVQVTPVEYGLDVDLEPRPASRSPGNCLCAIP